MDGEVYVGGDVGVYLHLLVDGRQLLHAGFDGLEAVSIGPVRFYFHYELGQKGVDVREFVGAEGLFPFLENLVGRAA